jgi:hypothetical protein
MGDTTGLKIICDGCNRTFVHMVELRRHQHPHDGPGCGPLAQLLAGDPSLEPIPGLTLS